MIVRMRMKAGQGAIETALRDHGPTVESVKFNATVGLNDEKLVKHGHDDLRLST
jgi:hypothetical protein